VESPAPIDRSISAIRGGDPVLKISGLNLSFGGVHALGGVDLEVYPDELLALIGPNGAGKTSLLNCISGFYRPNSGTISFLDQKLVGLPAHQVARRGIARTFQGTHLFSGMTVLDNIMIGRYHHMRGNLLQSFFYYPWAHREEIKHREAAEDVIDLLEIESIRHQLVGELGYGVRKQVDLGRALAMEPALLLMDEPMAGMNSEEKEDLARFILDVREARHIPVVLVEHDMRVVMDLADRVVVLNFGQKIAEGTPEEIQRHPAVIKAYFGESQ
jgi:branched-chain amino acid transport system ATP-binding protein